MGWADKAQATKAAATDVFAPRRKTAAVSPDIGRRFFESKSPHHVWIVSKVYTPPASSLPHVLLDRCGKFPASKLLSIEALNDTNFFKQDRRDPFSERSETSKTRRQSDPLKRS